MKEGEETIVPAPGLELNRALPAPFSPSRRNFLKVLGSGLTVTFAVASGLGSDLLDESLPEGQVGAWIHVNEDGLVTIYTGKAEVGQNIRTSLAQIVVEELHVPIDKVKMVMADTALTPYDRGTFGSRSIPYMGPQLRKAAATAREVLIEMGSEQLKVDRGTLRIENGELKSSSNGRSVNIGQITKGKDLVQPVNDNVSVSPVDQWKVAGKSVAKVNGESFVTGKHKYVSDMKLPDMLIGKVLRAPAYGATLTKVDVSAARSMEGVSVVHDGGFVGVAARDHAMAVRALKAIKAEWATTTQPSRQEIFEYLKRVSDKGKGQAGSEVLQAFAGADVKVEQTFLVDYIAHAPLEPRAGLAQWKGSQLTVWTGTQRPFGVQEDLAKAFGMGKENVRVIQPDTGSGYGGKHTGEAGVEAARLSKEAGRPVRVTWTREEEFTWAYFRPAGVIEVKAGVGRDGRLASWEFHNYNSGGSGIETPYEVDRKHIQFHSAESPLRQGSYRGLAATANVFARESVMNDLAGELKIDPLEFRLANLKEGRMRDVLVAAANAFGWKGYKLERDHGIGLGCGTEKASYVATCAEVAVDQASGDVKVVRVVVSFECGAIINPNHLENQIQGSVIQGLGGALFEQIDFKSGKVLNPSFSRYRVPRFSDMPQLEVVMLNRKDIPSAGAGETPILGIAPAVRNAIVSATGKKLYTLPLVPKGLS